MFGLALERLADLTLKKGARRRRVHILRQVVAGADVPTHDVVIGGAAAAVAELHLVDRLAPIAVLPEHALEVDFVEDAHSLNLGCVTSLRIMSMAIVLLSTRLEERRVGNACVST